MVQRDPLASAFAKIDRANKHVIDLHDACKRYFDARPCSTVSERDDEGALVFRLLLHKPIPQEIPLIAGDAIHNARSALDHAIVGLAEYKLGKANNHGFPIVDRASKLPKAIKDKVEGAGHEIERFVSGLQPYKGADNLFWRLRVLDNTDKHALIITTPARSRGPTLLDLLRTHDADTMDIEAGIDGRCLEHGDVLMIDRNPPPEDYDIDFFVDIAFDQPRIVDCEPIVPAVQQLVGFVLDVVNGMSEIRVP
jgi:hypothetical protein